MITSQEIAFISEYFYLLTW